MIDTNVNNKDTTATKYIYTSPAINDKDKATATVVSNSDYFGSVSLYSECGFSNVYFQSRHTTSFEDFRLYCGSDQTSSNNNYNHMAMIQKMNHNKQIIVQ